MQVQQPLDAPATKWGRDVSRVEIAGGGAGVKEMIYFAHIEFPARVEADAGGDRLAVLLNGGEDGRRAGGKLVAGPFFVEALLGEDFQQEGEVGIVWVDDPVD